MNKNCAFCGGSGKAFAMGGLANSVKVEIKCPKCNGTGNSQAKGYEDRKDGNIVPWSSKRFFFVEDKTSTGLRSIIGGVRFKIVGINLYDTQNIVYDIDAIDDDGKVVKRRCRKLQEDRAFLSFEDCQAWCDEMNEKETFS